jgi:pantoate--beta-alanine ligase
LSIPVYETIAALRAALKASGGDVGFVPTMGALHEGHARLIEVARQQSDVVAVSIFVNPLQFDRVDDYERYARTLDVDVALCETSGADLIFAPSAAELYPQTPQTYVDVQGVTEHFCGLARPGHFRGVATVVSKLFHIVQPQLAFFGEKDAQQLVVIQRMVADLNFAIRIVAVPTVREPDGLALSSRNARLERDQREIAGRLYLALSEIRERIAAGERDVAGILHSCRKRLEVPGIRTEYFDVADPATMVPVTSVLAPVRAMGAIWIGSTRLIDNVLCHPPIQFK